MKLPSDLQASERLRPGLVVVHRNAVGISTFGVIVSEVAGTFQVAYPSRLKRKVVVVSLEEFAPLAEIGVPMAAEFKAKDELLTAQRALALKDQMLPWLGSDTQDFLALCLHGQKESHVVDRLAQSAARVATTTVITSAVAGVVSSVTRGIRRKRRQ